MRCKFSAEQAWTTPNAAFLIALEDLVPGLARDAEIPAKFRHRLAG